MVGEEKCSSFFLKYWNEVKFIDRDPRWHTRKVEEAILIRLQPTKINRDSRMKIPGAWMPTTKKHNNRRAVRRRTARGTTLESRIETRQSQLWKNQPITAEHPAL